MYRPVDKRGNGGQLIVREESRKCELIEED